MKPVDVNDVKANTYINSIKEINNKDYKFKIGDIVRISKYKDIFAKYYTPIGQKKFLWLKKLKILCPGHMLLMILLGKNLLEPFTKKNCKKTNQKEFSIEKVVKGKGDKLYAKWERYNNLFNS